MEANIKCAFLIAFLIAVLAFGDCRPQANCRRPQSEIRSGVDRLCMIDGGDGSGPSESRWTPGDAVKRPTMFLDNPFFVKDDPEAECLRLIRQAT
jgi:hypothetical protein